MDLSAIYSVFSHVPVEWIVIGAFFLLIVADALRAGSVRAASLALSFPITGMLMQMIAQTALLSTVVGQLKNNIEQVILFAIIEAVIFVCVHQMLYSFDPYTSLVSSIVCGLAASVVVLVVWVETPALNAIWQFDPNIQAIFGHSFGFFWLIASYLALAFIGS